MYGSRVLFKTFQLSRLDLRLSSVLFEIRSLRGTFGHVLFETFRRPRLDLRRSSALFEIRGLRGRRVLSEAFLCSARDLALLW